MTGAQDQERWSAFVERDAARDGAFVVAVRTTGIYCRPSCPSRRPKRENVLFFDRPEAAEAAGFRPCKRCRPQQADDAPARLLTIERICRRIEDALATADPRPPTLRELAAEFTMSSHRLLRVFRRETGVTPREYADAHRLRRVKAGLKSGGGVAGALYGAGYGSSSRLYERAAEHLGMTPASYARGGRGASIGYTLAACSLGRLLVAATGQGVCMVSLGDDDGELVRALEAEFPLARIARDGTVLEQWVEALLAALEGGTPHPGLPLDVRGTAFQWQVWRELMAIPAGETRTYGDIARRLGRPGAARAVGRACATNPVSIAIPCHRAVGGDGALHGYRWGLARKETLLQRERRTADPDNFPPNPAGR